jgi:hypothetical protein
VDLRRYRLHTIGNRGLPRGLDQVCEQRGSMFQQRRRNSRLRLGRESPGERSEKE